MQHHHQPRNISPSHEYLPNSPSHRSLSPCSNASNGTKPPALHPAYTPPSSSPRPPLGGHNSPLPSISHTKPEMHHPHSSHFHPSLNTPQRTYTGPIRNYPYRSSSRASTTSSLDDGGDASNYSDSEHQPDTDRVMTAGIARKGSVHSIRSAPLLGESGSSEGMRALLANSTDEGSGSHTASLSSPTLSSPSFTFVPHSTQQATTGPLSLDSLPNYPPDQKPPFSYPVLIRLAILGSPQKRLLLSQIYSAIEEKFPWYRYSAPKAWKASVRHCLSLNKEFVRMQRAVEDPGVGCGGWWSVGEGMKGLKRPRKRRPPQSKRMEPDHEPSSASRSPRIKESSPTLRRRHSVHSDPSQDLYPSFIPSTSSTSSIPTGTAPLPPLHSDSLRLAPLQLPPSFSPGQLSGPSLPTTLSAAASSSRTLVFGGDRGVRSEDGWVVASLSGAGRGSVSSRGYSHTSTPSTSSSYSAYSRSDTSSVGGRRQNPMSISSLLNETDSATSSGNLPHLSGLATLSGQAPLPTSAMEVDMEDVDMKENQAGKTTPFSSDQTLRPSSPRPVSAASTKPIRPEQSRPSTRQVRGERSPKPVPTREKTPTSKRASPAPPSKSPKTSIRPVPSPGLGVFTRVEGPTEMIAPKGSSSSGKKKGSRAWDSVMDLSRMGMDSD